jgi:hypothetical protein
MSETSDHLTSRRAFATGAGILAAALGGVAKAATDTPWGGAAPPPGATQATANTASRQADLIKLSNSLYNSAAQRKTFLADPQGFASKLGLRNVTSTDLLQLKSVMADGFCCGGCGCS